MLADTSDSPTHTGDCDSSVPQLSNITSANAPPPFMPTTSAPPVWRRVFQAYVDVAAGDTARRALKKSQQLNAHGVEGLDVSWTLRNAQNQRGKRERLGTKARRMNTSQCPLC
ncbi:hypothetical protein MRX96_054161 [Rhipicephalus microplus]